jgi:phosphoribosylpyrophosphate synthetase
VLLVDDLIQSGGTLREAARALRTAGACSVSAYATHGVFPGESHGDLLQDLDRLYVTDSIPANRERFAHEPRAEVLGIAPLVSRMVSDAE